MNMSFDFAVFIGRFQPFHNGHLEVIRQGLRQSQYVILLLGSANTPRSLRNPFSAVEREALIRACFNDDDNKRLLFSPLQDCLYNESSWLKNVQDTVIGLVRAYQAQPHKAANIALLGHTKDKTSYYLKMFPQWQAIEVANQDGIDGKTIRKRLFSEQGQQWLADEAKTILPASALPLLNAFCSTGDYANLCAEQAFINQYQAGWANAPYTPTFVTTDAVVVQSGHLLLVTRKARPGKGLLALPGGFLGQDETLLSACIRELREETRLKVPEPVIKGSLKQQAVFDDPHRSSRGRTITHAFYFELPNANQLPKVRGGDDAAHARWVPLAQLNPAELYEDHYSIIQKLLN